MLFVFDSQRCRGFSFVVSDLIFEQLHLHPGKSGQEQVHTDGKTLAGTWILIVFNKCAPCGRQ